MTKEARMKREGMTKEASDEGLDAAVVEPGFGVLFCVVAFQ